MGCLNSKSAVTESSSTGSALHEVEFRETMERRSQQHLHQNVVPENFKKDIKQFYEIDRAIVLGTIAIMSLTTIILYNIMSLLLTGARSYNCRHRNIGQCPDLCSSWNKNPIRAENFGEKANSRRQLC